MSHVLVVEDEPITAADLEQKLLDMGHEVTWFDTGEEAVHRARDLAPDLVLMDIRLRGDLNGIETARQLREQHEVPIVFLTAFADQSTVDRACATQPYGYLLKPFTERAVATAVQVALTRADAERNGQERERWIARAVQDAGDAVIAVDDSGTIRFVNAQAESLLGVQAESVIGKDSHAVLQFAADELGGTMQPLEVALNDDRLTSSAARTLLCTPPGSKMVVSYSAAPVRTSQREKAGAVLVFREAQPDRSAATSESLAALDELSRRLAHEINNPLTYNLGALQLALRELDQLRAMSSLADAGKPATEREQQLLRIADYLRDAREGATRIAGVVRELNLFSLSERDRAPVQPVQLIELAVGLSKVDTAKQVRWEREVEAAPIVQGNKWQLAGVLAYALRNAVDALERRGVQEITVITAVTTDLRGWAALRVTAHGPDHSEFGNGTSQTMARAQPAQSTTVSRNLAEQVVSSHGGELVVVDLPAGRTIELYLPPMHVLGPELSSEESGEPQERRGSVLVVDNEPMIRRALEITLRPEHDVTSVSSAHSALELLARGDPFDVILYDLSLLDLSGADFYERLKALRPQVAQRIVFMKGVSNERDTVLRDLGVRQLEKPFTTEQLLARIAECMEARPSGAARAMG